MICRNRLCHSFLYSLFYSVSCSLLCSLFHVVITLFGHSFCFSIAVFIYYFFVLIIHNYLLLIMALYLYSKPDPCKYPRIVYLSGRLKLSGNLGRCIKYRGCSMLQQELAVAESPGYGNAWQPCICGSLYIYI